MGRLSMDLYLRHLKKRYFQASRQAKSKILDEFCSTSGYHRKHAIRLLTTGQWNEKAPRFVEADTVAHCGTSLAGDFVWSVTLTDIFSGWTENCAVWNKGAEGVVEHIHSLENSLPFL